MITRMIVDLTRLQVCSCHWAWCCSPGWALLPWLPPLCLCCCPPCFWGCESCSPPFQTHPLSTYSLLPPHPSRSYLPMRLFSLLLSTKFPLLLFLYNPILFSPSYCYPKTSSIASSPTPFSVVWCLLYVSYSFKKRSLESYHELVQGHMKSLSSSQISTHLGAEWWRGWRWGQEQGLESQAPVQGAGSLAATSKEQRTSAPY